MSAIRRLFIQLLNNLRNPGNAAMRHNRTHATRQKWSYSITSSARPSRESGTVMPSAFAVFKLTTNWILVNRWALHGKWV
jgi:hypothetical protein